MSERPPAPTNAFPWKPVVGLLVLLIVGVNIYYGLTLIKSKPRQPAISPVSLNHPVPEYSFIDQNGQPFGSADLEGKVYAAAFVFTRCPGPCPIITGNMMKVHEAFKDHPDVHLVSFSLDPEFDTPTVLTEYAERHQALNSNWKFLTGDEDAIRTLSQEGFFSAVKEPEPDERGNAGPIVHGTRICIVDQTGTLVATHEGLSMEGIDRTVKTIKSLIP